MIRIISLFFFCSLFFNLSAQRLYVNGSVAVSGDGSSWSTAFKSIEEAVASGNGNELWVTKGVYVLPTIDLVKSFAIYGGFEGLNETSIEERIVGNNTIIQTASGGIVFNMMGSDLSFVLDGLEFTGNGVFLSSKNDNLNNHYYINKLNVHDSNEPTLQGILSIKETGIWSLQILNSTFKNSFNCMQIVDAETENPFAALEIKNSVFDNVQGYSTFLSSIYKVIIEETKFVNNTKNNTNKVCIINNCANTNFLAVKFQNNELSNFLIDVAFCEYVTFSQCLFDNNKVLMANIDFISPKFAEKFHIVNTKITNNIGNSSDFIKKNFPFTPNFCSVLIESSTIVGNNFVSIVENTTKSSSHQDKVEFVNNIVWDNTFSASTPIGEAQFVLKPVANSCIGSDQKFDIYTQSACTSADPLFTNAAMGDYSLTKCSPAVNTGLNPSVTTGLTDLAGNTRVQFGVIDMGAYESSYEPCASTSTMEIGADLSCQVYPNPFSNLLSLRSKTTISQVSLINTAGHTVLSQAVNAASVELVTNHLPAGIYLIRIQMADGQLISQKMIKL